MDNPLDKTTLATISLLESRLLRIEHLLFGTAVSPLLLEHGSAVRKLDGLEKRLAMMLSHIRVYDDLLQICMFLLISVRRTCENMEVKLQLISNFNLDKSSPDLFHAPEPSEPPTQLPLDALQSIVMASAPSFPATLSSLTAIKDCPIPDPSASAAMVALTERMKIIEATQLAQASELAELRNNSEKVLRSWYENSSVVNAQLLADKEGRVAKAEKQLRRRERECEEAKEI